MSHVSHNNTTSCNTHLVGQSHLISTESDIGFRICILFASNGTFQDDIILGYALIGSLKSMFSDEVKTLIEMHFTLYILSDRYISRDLELVGNVVEYFRSLSYVVSQTAARLTLASWHFVQLGFAETQRPAGT